MKKIYYAALGGWINGALRQKGDPVGALTEREVKYLLMSGLVTETPPKIAAPEAAPAEATPVETAVPDAAPKKEPPAKKAEEPDPTTIDKKTR